MLRLSSMIATKNAAVATAVAPNTKRDAFFIGFIVRFQGGGRPQLQLGTEAKTPNQGTSISFRRRVAPNRLRYVSAHSAVATTPQVVLAWTRP